MTQKAVVSDYNMLTEMSQVQVVKHPRAVEAGHTHVQQ